MQTSLTRSRRLHSVLVVTVISVFLSVFALPAARADKYKTPDQTPNDHPSGKDRSAGPGTSDTQGKAVSDPDADTNGGADKPGMSGGFDADQDGNNGCGNDDDFEDDNNGWCGRHPKPSAQEAAAVKAAAVKAAKALRFGSTHASTDTTASTDSAENASVLGVTFERTATGSGGAATSAAGASVLGSTTARGAAAGALAATGSAHLGSLAMAALVMIGLGFALALGAVVADRRRLALIRLRVRR